MDTANPSRFIDAAAADELAVKPNGKAEADLVTLALTKQEALALAQLIDAAVRYRGIEAAEAGLVLHRKLQAAVASKL
jgi:hypothetical protein